MTTLSIWSRIFGYRQKWSDEEVKLIEEMIELDSRWPGVYILDGARYDELVKLGYVKKALDYLEQKKARGQKLSVAEDIFFDEYYRDYHPEAEYRYFNGRWRLVSVVGA